MPQSVGSAGLRSRLSDALVKTFPSTLVANLPMLALLLVPPLMRSRAGSESMLMIGSVLYLALVAVALTTSPWLSAWAAPIANVWTPHTVRETIYGIRRSRPKLFWQRIAEWLVLFLITQAIGLSIAWLMPYIQDNPQFGAGSEPRWTINYRNYAVQAVSIYLFSCFSFAWFGARLRELAMPR